MKNYFNGLKIMFVEFGSEILKGTLFGMAFCGVLRLFKEYLL